MSDFLYLFRGSRPLDPAADPVAAQKQMERWANWTRQLQNMGVHVGGEILKNEIKTVSQNGMVTDGPYAEVKEIIGGYIIVKAASLEQATEIAHGCPIFESGGSVEVREIQAMDMGM